MTKLGNQRVLETVCSASYTADKTLGRYSIRGPHVQPVRDGLPEIWIYEDEWGRDSRRIRIKLKGAPKDWYEHADRFRLLDVKWNGKTTQT